MPSFHRALWGLMPENIITFRMKSESHSVVSDSLQPHRLHSPWNSPGQNTGVGSLSLLQRVFPTQESNQRLLHCRWILHQLREWRKPHGRDLPLTLLTYADLSTGLQSGVGALVCCIREEDGVRSACSQMSTPHL